MPEHATTNRPPMNGDRTDDIGMMSTPIYFEHGEPDDAGTPALGMSVELRLPADLMTDATIAAAEQWIEDTYTTSRDGYGAAWLFDADDSEDGEHYWLRADVEFYAIGGYDGDESLESYVDRVTAATPFWRVYNDFVLFSHAEDGAAASIRDAA